MGNLSSNLNQNIQDFANNLIEEERSKNNSLDHSRKIQVLWFLGEYEEDKFGQETEAAMIGLK